MNTKYKSIFIILLILMSGIGLQLQFANAAGVKYEYYSTGDDDYGEVYGVLYKGQTFTTASQHYVSFVRLLLYRVGNPGTLTVGIYATSSGLPTGTALASGTINANTFTTSSSGAWYNVTLTTPYQLSTSTVYCVVLNGGVDVNNKIGWRTDLTSPSYSGGNFVYSNNGGSSWAGAAYDFLFEIWDLPIVTTTNVQTSIISETTTATGTSTVTPATSTVTTITKTGGTSTLTTTCTTTSGAGGTTVSVIVIINLTSSISKSLSVTIPAGGTLTGYETTTSTSTLSSVSSTSTTTCTTSKSTYQTSTTTCSTQSTTTNTCTTLISITSTSTNTCTTSTSTSSTLTSVTGGQTRTSLPDQISVSIAGASSGVVSQVWTKDTSVWSIAENNGNTPVLEAYVDFQNIPQLYNLHINIYGQYVGSSQHVLNLEIYDPEELDWHFLDRIDTSASPRWYNTTYNIDSDNIVDLNNQVHFRFTHITNGNTGHYLLVDLFVIEYQILAASTTTTCETTCKTSINSSTTTTTICNTSIHSSTSTTCITNTSIYSTTTTTCITNYHTDTDTTLTTCVTQTTCLSTTTCETTSILTTSCSSITQYISSTETSPITTATISGTSTYTSVTTCQTEYTETSIIGVVGGGSNWFIPLIMILIVLFVAFLVLRRK